MASTPKGGLDSATAADDCALGLADSLDKGPALSLEEGLDDGSALGQGDAPPSREVGPPSLS